MKSATDSAGMGVQTWPLATGVAVTATPLPMVATAPAKAPPHPSPLPRTRGRGGDSSGAERSPASVVRSPDSDSAVAKDSTIPHSNSLSPASGGEGWGEGAAEADQPEAPTTASEATSASAPIATVPVPEKPTTIAQATAPSVDDGASFGRPADTAGAVGSTVVALLLVVGAILVLAWLAKRMPGIGGASNPALKVVGSLALGPRERVVVVAVGDTQLLLSSGPGGTRTLHQLEQPLPVAATQTPQFAQLLAQQFGRKKS